METCKKPEALEVGKIPTIDALNSCVRWKSIRWKSVKSRLWKLRDKNSMVHALEVGISPTIGKESDNNCCTSVGSRDFTDHGY